MKFRKGNLVEVLRKEHDPCGSWFTGNILSSDGDNYIVRYKLLMDQERKQVVEKVKGKDVRPLPPSVNGKSWAVGDMAEVFDIQCWKVGKVAKVSKNNDRFVIKFFGSIQLKEFHASCLRIRQAWHGNKWMMIGKVAKGKDLANNFTPKIPYHAGGLLLKTSLHRSKTLLSGRKYRVGQHDGGADNVTKCLCMRAISRGHAHQSEDCNMDPLFGGTLKKRKSPPCSRGCDETLKGALPLFKQVDDISCPHIGVDEKFIKHSTNRNNRMEDKTPHCLFDSSRPVWSTEVSDQCSVASCSYNGVANYAGQISHKSSENTPDNSDAESSFPSLCGQRDLRLSPVDIVVDVHELELHAYKSTVEALYASGPLTWEQESLLTNLRLSLNISDEEHLLQLRHLLSAQVL
ncbi:uncharacterized protein LOC111305234 [Durio zibethinus]|uniref:Uncharacterized protein LOC111305234 n=1 Tax=Durio zibethinus TaxID=66656 RepID=A0A6P5ZZZ1_DURZI|nr:uncharacterized protein LOC111305234 [Durio zibethinus]